MNDVFKRLLEEQSFLPYTKNWKIISLNHNKDSIPGKERKKIRGDLGKVGCGIYIYTNLNKDVLYIGEGILEDRLIRHYEKTYKVKEKGSPRYYFFNKHKETMIVYYKELTNQYEREAVEAMLIVVLQPLYNQLLKAGKLTSSYLL